jgi:cell division protease FtsH
MDDEPSIRKQAPLMVSLALAGMGLLFAQWLLAAHNTVETIPYSKFEQLVGQGAVSDVIVGKDTIEGNLKNKLCSCSKDHDRPRCGP